MRRLEMLSDSVPLFLRVQSRTSQRVPASGLVKSLPLSQWAELTVIWSPSISAVSPNEKLSVPASTEDSAVVVLSDTAPSVVVVSPAAFVVVVSAVALVVVVCFSESLPQPAAAAITTSAATIMPNFCHIDRFFHQPGGFCCLLYTSDAADDLLCVDLGGRRIIKKKKIKT